MITMDTVLVRGLTWWDQALFPRDEFEERTRAIQRVMAEHDLGALTIWSDYFHTRGDVAYLAGWPMGGVLLLLPEGEPILFSPGGSRERHFAAQQVWCDLRASPGDVVTPLMKAIEDAGLHSRRIGLVGADEIGVESYHRFEEAAKVFQVVDVTDPYRAVRRAKRPREIMAIARSARVAELAIAAGAALVENGPSNAAALVEAERVARREGARDFRGLVNSTGCGLRPFEGLASGEREPLILWAAVDQHGYWGVPTYWSSGPSTRAAHALEAMLSACRPGARVCDMATRALSELPAETHDLALSYGLGSGIGLDLNEAPVITPQNGSLLLSNEVLALQVYAGGTSPSFAMALVRVHGEGFERLGGL